MMDFTFMGAETIHSPVKSGPWMILERHGLLKAESFVNTVVGDGPVLGMFVNARYWNGSVMPAIVPKYTAWSRAAQVSEVSYRNATSTTPDVETEEYRVPECEELAGVSYQQE
ncbi:hypothetical protein PAXINDRAFT_158708 [Paxillus involutus ATCC 200175]|uniref:Uncharacterized protein n=1 Tax=Paxillus involutus ATCC 200175 TaxID=664439 RepID=A0A0C9SV82_PAXIN|nr:hypothetical protein PAXINDRAFT_158708 [Paxillus involutus ATCC 200175]